VGAGPATPALLFDAEDGKETVLAALEAHGWDMPSAAESLGMTLPLLRAHVKKFGLSRKAVASR
jgi:hypothetical protein